MRVMVRFGTANEIERSAYLTDEQFVNNAINAGFNAKQVEIISIAEFDVRKALEPVPVPQPSEMETLKQQVASQQAIIDELLFEVIPSLLPITDEEMI